MKDKSPDQKLLLNITREANVTAEPLFGRVQTLGFLKASVEEMQIRSKESVPKKPHYSTGPQETVHQSQGQKSEQGDFGIWRGQTGQWVLL